MSGILLQRWFRLFVLGATLAGANVAPAADAARAETKALIQGFLKAWETGDAVTFKAALHPDVLFAYPGGRLGYDEVVALFGDYQSEKTDIKIYFADFFITDGDRYVTAYQFAATDRATEQRFAVGTGVVCRVADGKIVLFKEYWDSELAARQKAGELPLDEGGITPWPSSVWLRPDTID
ncbi:nuclear transport factor 2 family protein [Synoicihabitans lomoniglobus]|uniref:Nuclear transport factor 2 family protein n=1 Tax=Synoicihabitans lomoniglobus TaxID=2909285 RepID=A0AAF0I490_9BACT|nr:nuclear transport factor 2 family protein [Opitutaceae bacterium LMO-M01]WED66629.1 nuclear transport factor 2 family protein [Opitutaceae bacterium LMO-M01]